MTTDEIYSRIANHMIRGLMTHEQLANYYDFLGLKGYKRCHEYHYIAETCNYRKLCRYYINHFNKLIPYSEVDNPHIIPDTWYVHVRQDVDTNTKKNAVKNGLQLWVDWERETKHLYEQLYKELMDINEVAAACNLKYFIKDVDHELKKAERYLIEKESVSYDMVTILDEQQKKHDKYKCKVKEVVGEILC